MKMAKPSETDIDAAGELCRLLNVLDEGNRWSSGALGDTVDFFEIEDFDPEEKAHLESLYDKLMNQYRAIFRTGFNQSKQIDVMANNHLDARFRVEHQTGLTVLSTEFIG